MTDHYLKIRALHIACAFASIILFVIRHVLNLRGAPWRKSRALRIMPHVVDTVLLAAGIALMVITHQYPFVNAWLTVKVIALVAYILLGRMALRQDASNGTRRASFLAAATLFAFIVSVARTHSPWGIFAQL